MPCRYRGADDEHYGNYFCPVAVRRTWEARSNNCRRQHTSGSVCRAIRIDFENRFCFTGAFVLGNEPLLGAVPMEEMDLVVHPSKQKVMPNPEHPNIPQYIMY